MKTFLLIDACGNAIEFDCEDAFNQKALKTIMESNCKITRNLVHKTQMVAHIKNYIDRKGELEDDQ